MSRGPTDVSWRCAAHGALSHSKVFWVSDERFDVASQGDLVASVRFDDGAIVYLNGVEISRENMPEGPVRFETMALSQTEGDRELRFARSEPFPGSLLRRGWNVLAAEVHKEHEKSHDMIFDMELGLLRMSMHYPEENCYSIKPISIVRRA